MSYRTINLEAIIDVGDWIDAEEPVTGSRVKKTVIEPKTGQLYIFKQPKLGREAQIWSELLASYIAGDLLNWPAQHVAIAKRGDQFGNLMRYFYQAEIDEFIEGVEICKAVKPDYDTKKGEDHSLDLVFQAFERKIFQRYGVDDHVYFQFWARALALDALISNTDRHAENWGVVSKWREANMAPLYDNATSMGCGIDEKGLSRLFDSRGALKRDKITQFMEKGRHHLRLEGQAKKGALFEPLCKAFLQRHPAQRAIFAQAASLDLSRLAPVMDAIMRLSPLEAPFKMTLQRKMHIMTLLEKGKERINRILFASE